MRAWHQQTLAAVLIVLMLGVSAKSVELFRYRYNGEDGAEYEAVFETHEQSVGKTVDKEKAEEIAMAWMHVFLSAIGQTRPAIIEIKGLKTSHFKESKTAPWDRGEIGSMGHVQCPQSESANNDLQPGRSRMVAATDCERVGDQSRDSRPVFALGKTSHFDHRR